MQNQPTRSFWAIVQITEGAGYVKEGMKIQAKQK